MGMNKVNVRTYVKLIESTKSKKRKTLKAEKQHCEGCNFELQYYLVGIYPGEPKYNLCANCLCDLVNCRLSPKQFNNLIRKGHTIKEFWLHEDFYNERGKALQPSR